MKKILILGSKGMLGHVLTRYLSEQKDYDVTAWDRTDIDVTRFHKLTQMIIVNQFEIVINCVGALNSSPSLDRHAELNVMLPRVLANLSDTKLIHISTNCVFKDIGPHIEDEVPDANDLYGMSKAMGEIEDAFNLTVRCSITGPELKRGTGLFEWFINQSPSEVTGYKNAIWNGVTTLQLSKFIDECIRENYCGLKNYYSDESTSKAKILKHLNKIYNLNKTIKCSYSDKVHSSLLQGPHYTTKTIPEQFEEMKEWY